MTYRITKRPDETADYGVDWLKDLGTTTISASTWAASSADVTVVSASNTTTTTSVRLSGGQAGQTYYLENRVTCADGQILEAEIELLVSKVNI
jgi:hypothetical protein